MCRHILQDAQDKRVECYVSALMLIECEVALSTQEAAAPTAFLSPQESSVEETSSDGLVGLFESEFIIRCNVDPFVGELARHLKSQMNSAAPLTNSQWLWLATALLQECDYLMTYEPKLLKLAGHTALGSLNLVVPFRPWSSGQLTLQDVDGVMDGVANTAPIGAGIISRRSVEI
jgi:hypothetical protein